MRTCSRVVLNAMCGAYCRAHTDPAFSLINAFRGHVAAPLLPNERKMAFCSIKSAANNPSVHYSSLSQYPTIIFKWSMECICTHVCMHVCVHVCLCPCAL